MVVQAFDPQARLAGHADQPDESVEDQASAAYLREARYRALLDTAADIASAADSEQQLGRIVVRARELARADVVYLWLVDDGSESAYLGATAGGMSTGLNTLRVPMGRGITGRVIETGLPFITPDYWTESGFTHNSETDNVMRRESITAAVGVPLIVGDRRLGALIAANRDERVYTSSDVTLLSSLAAHAAIAMERAHLLKETTDALFELEVANSRLMATHEASELAAEAHVKLSNVVLAGGGLNGVVQAIMEILGGDLILVDQQLRLLAGKSSPDVDRVLATGDALRAASSRASQVTDSSAVVPVLAGNRHLATMIFASKDSLRPADIRTLERAAIVAALLLLFSESEAGAAGSARDQFLQDLIGAVLAGNRIVHAGARLQVDLAHPFTAHVIAAKIPARRLTSFAHAAARELNGLAGQCHLGATAPGPVVVALVPGTDARKNSRALAAALKDVIDVDLIVTGAGPSARPTDASELITEAQRCQLAMQRLKIDKGVATMADLGFVGLVLSERVSADTFVDALLGEVTATDDQRHTDLLATLEALLQHDCSPTAAAKTLHMHVNTVKQRMTRLTTLLGEDWRSPDRATELRIALRLRRLREITSSQ